MVPLGAYIKPYGKVGMIGNLSGERYYWMHENNSVAMMPATIIEKMYEEQKK